ncbi:MAG: aromatic acid exporter family protein [Treponema sp.]|jgi:uncharacterized membrane protein YgaE (UPF0421/DUF939 family)|nr:aromatic acid exporter family protein [Treponema sp.]
MQKTNTEKMIFTSISLKIGIAVGICLLMAMIIPEFQTMTACISVLLCVQNKGKESGKAGLIRLAVTAIGGFIAILVTIADNLIGSQWFFIAMIILGLIVTLSLCQFAHLPAFNARIGGVTFILVVLTKTGTDRISYALFRLLSTSYGAATAVAVVAVYSLFEKHLIHRSN